MWGKCKTCLALLLDYRPPRVREYVLVHFCHRLPTVQCGHFRNIAQNYQTCLSSRRPGLQRCFVINLNIRGLPCVLRNTAIKSARERPNGKTIRKRSANPRNLKNLQSASRILLARKIRFAPNDPQLAQSTRLYGKADP
jgi:hypothetical protein